MNLRVACLIADRITDGEPLLTNPGTWTDRTGKPFDEETRTALQESGVAEVRAAFALAEVRAVGHHLAIRSVGRYIQLLEPYLDGRTTLDDIRARMSPLERAELDDLLALTPGLPHLPPPAYGRVTTGNTGGHRKSTTNRKEPAMGKKDKHSKTDSEARAKARYTAGLLIGEAFAHENDDDPDDYRRGFRDGFQTAHGINPADGSPLF